MAVKSLYEYPFMLYAVQPLGHTAGLNMMSPYPLLFQPEGIHVESALASAAIITTKGDRVVPPLEP